MTVTTKREDLISRLNNERRVLAAAEKLRRESTRGRVVLTAAAQTRAALEVAEMQDAIRETERAIALWDKIVKERVEDVKIIKRSIVSAKSCLREIEIVVNDYGIDGADIGCGGSAKDQVHRIVDLVNQFTCANNGSYVEVSADDIVRTVWPLLEDGGSDAIVLRSCAFRVMRTWIKGAVGVGDQVVDVSGLFWRWWWQWRNEPRYKWLCCIYEKFGVREENGRFGLGGGEWEPLVVWIIRGVVRQEVECLQFVRTVLQCCGEIGALLVTPTVLRGVICMGESGVINGVEMNLLYIMCCIDAVLHASNSAARCGVVDYLVKTVLDPMNGGIAIPVLLRLFEGGYEWKKFVRDSGFIPLLLTTLLEGNENEEEKSMRIRRHSAKVVMSLLASAGGVGAFANNGMVHLKTLIAGLGSERVSVKYAVLAVICGSLGIHKPNVLIGGDGVHPELFLWEKIEFGECEEIGGPPGRAYPEIGGIIRRVCEMELIEMYIKCDLIKEMIKQFEVAREDSADSRWFAFAISEIIYLRDYYGIINNGERISFRLNRFIERETRKHYRLLERGRVRLGEKIHKEMDEYILEVVEGGNFIIENKEEADKYDEPIDFERLNWSFIGVNEEKIGILIMNSNVLATKEFWEWNWEIIEQIVKYYFCHSRILEEELLKGSKFIKRLVSFYKPQKAGFVTLRGDNKGGGQKFSCYIEVGISLMKDLAMTITGLQILRSSLIIPTIIASVELYIDGDCEEVVMMENEEKVGVDNGEGDGDGGEYEGENDGDGDGDGEGGLEGENVRRLGGLFTRERLSNSPVAGYVRMICTLTELPLGVGLLEEYGGIGVLFKLLGLRNDEGGLSGIARKYVSPRVSGILRVGLEKVGSVGSVGSVGAVTTDIEEDEYSLIKWAARVCSGGSGGGSGVKAESSTTRGSVVTENAFPSSFWFSIARETYAVSRGLAVSTLVDRGGVSASIGPAGGGGGATTSAATAAAAAAATVTTIPMSVLVTVASIDATMEREELCGCLEELCGCLYAVAGGIVARGEEAVGSFLSSSLGSSPGSGFGSGFGAVLAQYEHLDVPHDSTNPQGIYSTNSNASDRLISKVTTSNDGNYVYLGNKKFAREDLIQAFGGSLQPGLAPPSVHKFANPAPLGLCAFALTTFVLSLANAGAMGVENNSVVIGLACFYGGFIQLLAGMWEMSVENTFGAVALSSYGGFWMAFAAIHIPWFNIQGSYDNPEEFANMVGFFLLGWCIFTFMLTLCTMKSTLAFFSLFFLLSITFLLLAIADLGKVPNCKKAGGILGVIVAFIAWYNAYAGISNKQNSYIRVKAVQLPVFEKND
ncbi:hypothetical protein CANINC_004150 [Pichia inconspicua]|uniref:Rapamycin-insensitive companion of mTOR middle domain-containing protein n=1 Tax=Pichia inconspicua TaxID=52247 RepID=A0A4T0WYD3_9ASCO|nr:hypothetical protein CANINC_004150 [[Candida] inconspicua]